MTTKVSHFSVCLHIPVHALINKILIDHYMSNGLSQQQKFYSCRIQPQLN